MEVWLPPLSSSSSSSGGSSSSSSSKGGWVHLDPCEAAVDEPLLYQSWGKNQTYILAFTHDQVQEEEQEWS